MRVPHHLSRHRAVIGALALTGALLASTTAFAEAANVGDLDEESPAAGESPCPDPLVTLHPGGAIGDADAVVITAQALEAGRSGWSLVAWEAAPGTVLRTVQAADGDGSWRSLPATSTGDTEGDVTALRFCGGASELASGITGSDAGATLRFASNGPNDIASGDPGEATSSRSRDVTPTGHGEAASGEAEGAGQRQLGGRAFGLGALAGLVVLAARRRVDPIDDSHQDGDTDQDRDTAPRATTSDTAARTRTVHTAGQGRTATPRPPLTLLTREFQT